LRTFRIRLLACLFGLATSVLLPAVAAADPHVLVLGCVSNDPKVDYDALKPLLDYVVPRMAGVGIREGRVLMARDMQQMGSYLRRGRVDWVTGSVATGLQLQARAGAVPLLLSERNGLSHDRTVFFVRRDSAIATLRDLRGHSIAFKDSASPGAYFVPAMELLQQDMSLQRLLSPMDRPDGRSVGFVLGGSDLNVVTWVSRGLVDAGAMGQARFDDPSTTPASLRASFRAIGTSNAYPLALEVSRSDLDPRVRARLRELLAGAAADPDAREAMLQFSATSRFLPIDAADEATLQSLRTGIARVRAEVE
jgi:phosphonate transport system substrate-binding protein